MLKHQLSAWLHYAVYLRLCSSKSGQTRQLYLMLTDLAHYVVHISLTEFSHLRRNEDVGMGNFVFSNPSPVQRIDSATKKFW